MLKFLERSLRLVRIWKSNSHIMPLWNMRGFQNKLCLLLYSSRKRIEASPALCVTLFYCFLMVNTGAPSRKWRRFALQSRIASIGAFSRLSIPIRTRAQTSSMLFSKKNFSNQPMSNPNSMAGKKENSGPPLQNSQPKNSSTTIEKWWSSDAPFLRLTGPNTECNFYYIQPSPGIFIRVLTKTQPLTARDFMETAEKLYQLNERLWLAKK